MSPLVMGSMVFIGVAALVVGVTMAFSAKGSSRVEDRLDLLTGNGSSVPGRDNVLKQSSVLARPLDDAPALLEGLLERLGNFQRLFDQADTTLNASKLAVISAILAVIGCGLTAALRAHPAFVPLGGIAGGVAVQLPEAMEMMARVLRAGQSLGFGFSVVSSEMSNPISKEFGRVFDEQNLGIPVEESLYSLCARVPNLDLKFFTTAVILQRQTGGDLAEILDKIGNLIRDRFRVFGQVQALTGEGRLSGVVLLGLPFVLFLAVYYMNPGYITVLFTDPIGKKMLAVAIFMQVLGALVIRKIVNIQV